jgi:hypothetical protein
MVPRARLCLGKGARCSVLLKFLRPSKNVNEAILNPVQGQWLDDLIAVSREVTTHGGKSFVSIFFRSNTIPGLLHSAECWVTVLEQPTGEVWSGEAEAPAAVAPLAANKAGEEIADFVFHAIIGQKISPSTETWDSRWTTTTNLHLKTSQPTMALVWLLGGFSLKGRSGAGTESTREQGLVGCTIDQHLWMVGRPKGTPSLTSSFTSFPFNFSST